MGAHGLYERAVRAIAAGDLGSAESDLERLLIEDPDRAGAWLDLALVKCAQGQPEPALALLVVVESRFSPPPAVREVVKSVRARGCSPKAVLKAEWGLKWARGTDSNVNQGTTNTSLDVASDFGPLTLSLTSDYLPRPDQWTALSADWAAPVLGGGAMAFAHLQVRGYDTMRAFDQAASTAGLELPWVWGGWSWRGAQLLGWSALGGAPNQRIGKLHIQALRALDEASRWEGGASLSWARLTYPELADFDARLLEARALLSYRAAPLQAQLGLGAAYDQGSAQRPGRDRRGFNTSLSLRALAAGGSWADVSLSMQVWEGSAPYFPGLIDARRRQEARTVRLGLTTPVARGHNLRLDLSDLRSQDNVPMFSYSGRQLSVAWEWLP